MNIQKIRSNFPILSKKINKNKLIYFDNSATTQKPKSVIDAEQYYYLNFNANIHRGIHYLAEKSEKLYEQSKAETAKFINSKPEEIIYTKNTTESLNILAYSLCLNYLKKGDLILISEAEHHSNLVPWQQLAKKFDYKLKFIPILNDFSLDINSYKKLLLEKPKIVSINYISNVLGEINPVKEITQLAHENGSIVIIDGAQSTGHIKTDVTNIDCDFFAFSSHKMYGPQGMGVLYGKYKQLEKLHPFLFGGGMIESVSKTNSTFNSIPNNFEAGTPNVAGAYAHLQAIKFLNEVNFDSIRKHEIELTKYTLEKLSQVKGIEIFGKKEMTENRSGVISFYTNFAHPHDIADLLNSKGIAIRAGNHCAQPLHQKFCVKSTARISFGCYNTIDEIDIIIKELNNLKKIFK